jgi:molecular chaperone GrpE
MNEEKSKDEKPAEAPASETPTDASETSTEASGQVPTNASGSVPTDASEIEKLKRERDEYLAGWQRAKADFANYQKDEARRNEEFAKWALAAFISELLPIIDSFDVALAETKSETEVMGLKLIRSQLLSTLAKYGLEPIPTEKGAAFNPELHEAVSHEPADQPEDTIVEEIQKGYRLHTRVLRPSRVRVASGTPHPKVEQTHS